MLQCTDASQIHTVCAIDLILPFGSKSEPSDSFQKCFVDTCVIVSVKQELAISMKMLNLVFPYCFFVVVDHIMPFGIVASGDEIWFSTSS